MWPVRTSIFLHFHLSRTVGQILRLNHGHSYVDGLVQERLNSIANALELHLSRTNPCIHDLCTHRSVLTLQEIRRYRFHKRRCLLDQMVECELCHTQINKSRLVTHAMWHVRQVLSFNSLAPWKFEWNFICVICKQILVIDGWGTSCEIALIWMSLDFADDKSTLV